MIDSELTADQKRAVSLIEACEPPENEAVKETPEQQAGRQTERDGVFRLTVIALVWVFQQGAKRGGDHWQLSAGESEELGNALVDTVYHYWPDLDFGPAVQLLVVGAAIVVPRVAITRQMVKEKPVQEIPQSEGGEE